jgi:hypothetical protein
MIRTTIEITIEDIELMLDLLGPPEDGEHHRKASLRRKLQEIIMAKRQGKTVPDDFA